MRAPIQAIRWPGVCAVERNGASPAAQTPGAVGAGAERGALATGLAVAVALGLLAASAGAAAAQTASEPRLLVLLRDASALAVVDPAEGTVLGQVPTVGNPHEVAATPDGRLAFVASPSEGISVIDLESMTEVRRLDVGAGSVPHDVRFVDGKLYFTIEGFKSIARYDPQADEVDWTLGLGQDGAHMMIVSRDRDTIFTANRESDTVSIVEGAAAGPPDWQVTSIPADGAYPEGLDLSPDGAELWVATRNDGDVTIIDVAAKTVSERLDLNFEDPNRLAFTPDGARVLVSDSATSVVVMDAAARTEITRFDLAPNALLVRPGGACRRPPRCEEPPLRAVCPYPGAD